VGLLSRGPSSPTQLRSPGGCWYCPDLAYFKSILEANATCTWAGRWQCELIGQFSNGRDTPVDWARLAAPNASEAATAAPTTSGTTRGLLAKDDIKSDDELETEVLKQLRELLANGGCVFAMDPLAHVCIMDSPRVASVLSLTRVAATRQRATRFAPS